MRGWRKNKPNALKKEGIRLQLHPLFVAVGIWYSLKGELFLFLLSCLVAVQHECAHAFAAAKLGYKLRRIVLMPFGAVIDGDLRSISLKDEIAVAVSGPICNLITAAFFVAVWWFAPTTYAFTDTAYYSSVAIALVNLLPAYPLDGGRIFKCILERTLLKSKKYCLTAERLASKIAKAVTLSFAFLFFALFAIFLAQNTFQLSLLLFGLFLFFGALGNGEKNATYAKLDLSEKDALERGVELKRVAVLADKPIKEVFKYLTRGTYLVLEVYDEKEKHLFDVTQNELAEYFAKAENPYVSLGEIGKNCRFSTPNYENL